MLGNALPHFHLEDRIEAARQLMGGRDAVDRFLQWGVLDAIEEDAEQNDDE